MCSKSRSVTWRFSSLTVAEFNRTSMTHPVLVMCLHLRACKLKNVNLLLDSVRSPRFRTAQAAITREQNVTRFSPPPRLRNMTPMSALGLFLCSPCVNTVLTKLQLTSKSKMRISSAAPPHLGLCERLGNRDLAPRQMVCINIRESNMDRVPHFPLHL